MGYAPGTPIMQILAQAEHDLQLPGAGNVPDRADAIVDILGGLGGGARSTTAAPPAPAPSTPTTAPKSVPATTAALRTTSATATKNAAVVVEDTTGDDDWSWRQGGCHREGPELNPRPCTSTQAVIGVVLQGYSWR